MLNAQVLIVNYVAIKDPTDIINLNFHLEQSKAIRLGQVSCSAHGLIGTLIKKTI